MVRDATNDILKIMDHLIKKNVIKEDNDCANTHPPFTDLQSVGLKKLTTNTWLQDLLMKGISDEDMVEEPHMEDLLDEPDQLFELF